MARKAFLLLMGALSPAMGACANVLPQPAVMARADMAVPPMPAELLAASNGKADPPFQVGAALVMAALAQREEAVTRTARLQPSEMVRGVRATTPAGAGAVELAGAPALASRTASPRSAAVAGAGDRPVTVAALNPNDSAGARSIPYVEPVKADARRPASTRALPALHVAATPRRSAVRARRPTQVTYASRVPAQQSMLVAVVSPSAPPRAHRVHVQTGRKFHRATPSASIMVRIRTLVAGWLNTVRI